MGGYPLYSYLPQRSERGVQYKRNDSLSFLHIFPGRKNMARRRRKIFFFHLLYQPCDLPFFWFYTFLQNGQTTKQMSKARGAWDRHPTLWMFCVPYHVARLQTECPLAVLLPDGAQAMSITLGREQQHLWFVSHSFPGRSPNTLGVSDVEVDKARNEIIHNGPDVDTDRIAQEVLQMTREEVISRLRTLIDSPALEEQLERVRGVIPIFSYYLAERSQVWEDPRDIHVKTYIFVDKLLRQTFFH